MAATIQSIGAPFFSTTKSLPSNKFHGRKVGFLVVRPDLCSNHVSVPGHNRAINLVANAVATPTAPVTSSKTGTLSFSFKLHTMEVLVWIVKLGRLWTYSCHCPVSLVTAVTFLPSPPKKRFMLGSFPNCCHLCLVEANIKKLEQVNEILQSAENRSGSAIESNSKVESDNADSSAVTKKLEELLKRDVLIEVA